MFDFNLFIVDKMFYLWIAMNMARYTISYHVQPNNCYKGVRFGDLSQAEKAEFT